MKSMGRQFELFTRFVLAVQSGKKCIMFGSKYVALDRKTYDTLTKKIEKKCTSVWIDERIKTWNRKS